MPDVAAVVGADVAGKAAVVVGLDDVQNPHIAVTVPVGHFAEVAVGKVLDVADMGKGDAVAVGADDICHIVLGVGAQGARAQAQAVVGMVHHLQEAADGLLVHQQPGQAEDIPGGIVLVDGHLDAGLLTDRHDGFQEVFQVVPQHLLGDGGVSGKQLFQFGHPLRLPAGHGVALGAFQDVFGHLHGVILDQILLVIHGGGAIGQGVEQVGAGPVKHRHEVVGDHFDPGPAQIAQGGDVVLDVLVPGGTANLDVVVDIHRFHHVDVEAGGFDPRLFGGDFLRLPHFAGLLVMQGPHDAGDAGDLTDLLQGDGVIAFAVPAECHLHGRILLFGSAVKGQHDLADGGIMAVVEVKGFLGIQKVEGMGDAVAQIHLALVDQVDDGLELAVLQAAAPDIQLLGGDDELVDLVGGHAEAHGDDAAGVAGGLAGGQQAALEAGSVDGDGGAVAVGQLVSPGHHILGAAVDDVGGAVLQAFGQLGIVDIHHDQLVGVVQPGNPQDAVAQGAGADDHQVVLCAQLGTAAGLDGNGGGLDHDGVFVLQEVGQQVAVLLRHHHVLPVAAVQMDAPDLQVAADIGAALAAGVAVAAGSDLVDDDPVPHLPVGDAAAHCLDDTHHLVADDPGIGGGSIGAVIDAHVRAADAGGFHLDQDLIGLLNFGHIHIDDFQFVGLNNLNGFHNNTPVLPCGAVFDEIKSETIGGISRR